MRTQPVAMSGAEFREAGYQLVDTIANLLDHIGSLPVAGQIEPADIRAHLPAELPLNGSQASELVGHAADVLIRHSTLTGHPRFFGYINGSVAPIGILADMLASAVNPNCGGWALSPVASEIERQTIRWIAQMMGCPPETAGVLVSGGNMANMLGFLAARTATAGQQSRAAGLAASGARLTCYVSAETHTWVQKAADLFGIGTDAVRWIPTDAELRMDVAALRTRIAEDKAAGFMPFVVVATAGTVATGAVDPIREIVTVCKDNKIWLHVDGAYGGVAAVMPDADADLRAIALADSIAVDPHKWLYAPFEAGCALVRSEQALLDAFSYRPTYYHFEGKEDDPRVNFYERGMQNTRGFRALKVWLLIQQAGRRGYEQMIGDDVALSKRMFRVLSQRPDFEAVTQGLSITTFRYVPAELKPRAHEAEVRGYLNDLNAAILSHLQVSEDLFVSNAVVREMYLLRACITNWRTTEADVDAVPDIVAAVGSKLHGQMRRQALLVSD